MSWAQELKTLVADIKAGHEERDTFVRDLQHDTRKLLKDARSLLSELAKANRQLAKDIREFLERSDTDRLAAFKRLASDIRSFLKENQKDVEKNREETERLLHGYKKERAEAQGHWRSLAPRRKRGRGRPPVSESAEE